MALNGQASAARRMAEAIAQAEGGREPLYFGADGHRLMPGGRSFNGARTDWRPQSFAFCVEHPFRPSVASCGDMVADFQRTGESIRYDEERWEEDPRIAEQAGPSLVEDWYLVELIEKRVAA